MSEATRTSGGHAVPSAWAAIDKPDLRTYAAAALLSVFVCSAFTVAASLGLLTLYALGAFDEAPPFLLRLWLKTALFLAFTTAIGWWCFKLFRARDTRVSLAQSEVQDTKRSWMCIGVLLVLHVALLWPKLDRYPWPAPS